jgi:DNA-binding transcriptional LysR family regulator
MLPSAGSPAVLTDQHWLGVEVRHLAALEAIEAERSFRGAAERLGYVQSAVSQQLSALERLVGARLVERTRGQSHVELTEAGLVLLAHGQRILATLRAARADLEALASDGRSMVRLGAFQSVAAYVVPRVLAQLAAAAPEVWVETHEASTDEELFGAVAAGELDCAFAELPLRAGPFESVAPMTDPCVLVVHEESPLARRPRCPTLDEIARMPLAYPSWRMGDLIRDQFRAVGLEPTRTFALRTNTAVQALARAGVAAAIMPLLAVDRHLAGTSIIDLSPVLPSRTLVLYWHRDRIHGAALAEVIGATRATCRETARSADVVALSPSPTVGGRSARRSRAGAVA